MITVREVIPAALAGERLDRIVSLVTDVSRADAAALVGQGAVEVNGEVSLVKAQRLSEGDALTLRWEPGAERSDPVGDPEVVFPVVYEDEHVLVIDKPAGLVVHPGAGHATGTLVHGLLARHPGIADIGEAGRPGIVHRLDKDTSGLMMVARSADAYAALVRMLADRQVDRRYLALVWGAFEVSTGVIDAPIGRSSREPTRMAVSERGREAITRYAVLDGYTEPVCVSLVECRLETGRTHQIRVHMQAIHHPVVGDTRYRGNRQSLPAPRMFLHAAHLAFAHPLTGVPLSFDAPLPGDLATVLATLH